MRHAIGALAIFVAATGGKRVCRRDCRVINHHFTNAIITDADACSSYRFAGESCRRFDDTLDIRHAVRLC